MKVVFVSQDDPLYLLPFFDEWFRNYEDEFTIAELCCCRVMGNRSRKELLSLLYELYGFVGLGTLLARTARSKVLGRLTPAGPQQQMHAIEQVCRVHRVAYRRIGNPNTPEFAAHIRELAPDVVVSVACPYILKRAFLEIPRLGCINIHHAPLPRYQGMMPTFWQMYHRESRVGTTVHRMAAKVDAGPALLREYLDIQPGETLDSLMRRSKRHGAQCVAAVLRQLQEGTVQELPALDHAPTYFTLPTVEQIREFRSRGLRAI